MPFYFTHIAYTEGQLRRAKQYLLATRKDFPWFAAKKQATRSLTNQRKKKNTGKKSEEGGR